MSWQYAFFLVSENFTCLFFATPDLLSLELIRLVRAVKLVPPSISVVSLSGWFRVALCCVTPPWTYRNRFKLSSDIFAGPIYIKVGRKAYFVKVNPVFSVIKLETFITGGLGNRLSWKSWCEYRRCFLLT